MIHTYPTGETMEVGDTVSWHGFNKEQYTGTLASFGETMQMRRPVPIVRARCLTGPGHSAGYLIETQPAKVSLVTKRTRVVESYEV